ncbi:MAG: hypothetical protein AB8G22_06890 [Saprospiraceae bacterium]
MDNEKYYLIVSIIEEIEKTDTLLKKLNALPQEAGSKCINSQIERKKRSLYQELLLELVNSKLQISEFKGLYHKIITYLGEKDVAQTIPAEQKAIIQKAALFI